MAFTPKNQKQEILKDIQKNNRGELIRISRIETDSGVAFDVRQLYTNDNDEVCYTSKGIRLSDELMYQVIETLLEQYEDAEGSGEEGTGDKE